MEVELYKQNPWWETKTKTPGIIRDKYFTILKKNLNNDLIIFLTGLRRIGKTTLIKQMIHELLRKTEPKKILYVSLDSFNLINNSIHEIINEYRTIHKISIDEKCFVFLDEITAKENFEQELKSLYDNDNLKIFASSSVATLMRDRRAMLTGRTKTIEILPLSFTEFLLFKNIKIKKKDKSKLEGYFRDYMKIGGIPYNVLTPDNEYIKELIESIIYKDIVLHYKIPNEKIIRELFVLLCERVGKITSYKKLANILSVSVDTVKRYIYYFEQAFLFYPIERFSKSPNENITSPKKFYAGDIGIRNHITGFRDKGAAYENLVFLKIKSEKPNYYLKDMIEIDFITSKKAIEAKYNQEMNEKQKAVFDKIKVKEKIIANGINFFLDE